MKNEEPATKVAGFVLLRKGRNTSGMVTFDIWLPREHLRTFLIRVADFDGAIELRKWIWFDGQRLGPSLMQQQERAPGEEEGKGYNSYFYRYLGWMGVFSLGLDFEMPFPLPAYALPYASSLKPGASTIRVENIDMSLDLGSYAGEWYGSGPPLDCVSFGVRFGSGTREWDELATRSESVRQYFVRLAQDFGGSLCALNDEWKNFEVVYVRDGSVVPDHFRYSEVEPPVRSLEPVDGSVLDKLSFCRMYEYLGVWGHLKYFGSLSRESHVQCFDKFSKDAEPGVRAASFKMRGLFGKKRNGKRDSLELERLEKGLKDEDWRVRSCVPNRVSGFFKPKSFQLLPRARELMLQALDDSHPEVRVEALRGLAMYQDPGTFEKALDMVTNLTFQPENHVLFQLALDALRWSFYINPSTVEKDAKKAIEAIENRAAESGFPFPDLAGEVLQTFYELQEWLKDPDWGAQHDQLPLQPKSMGAVGKKPV